MTSGGAASAGRKCPALEGDRVAPALRGAKLWVADDSVVQVSEDIQPGPRTRAVFQVDGREQVAMPDGFALKGTLSHGPSVYFAGVREGRIEIIRYGIFGKNPTPTPIASVRPLESLGELERIDLYLGHEDSVMLLAHFPDGTTVYAAPRVPRTEGTQTLRLLAGTHLASGYHFTEFLGLVKDASGQTLAVGTAPGENRREVAVAGYIERRFQVRSLGVLHGEGTLVGTARNVLLGDANGERGGDRGGDRLVYWDLADPSTQRNLGMGALRGNFGVVEIVDSTLVLDASTHTAAGPYVVAALTKSHTLRNPVRFQNRPIVLAAGDRVVMIGDGKISFRDGDARARTLGTVAGVQSAALSPNGRTLYVSTAEEVRRIGLPQ